MSKRCYVVMSERYLPVAICMPKPVAVFTNLKEARKFVHANNESNRSRTDYFLVSVPLKDIPPASSTEERGQ